MNAELTNTRKRTRLDRKFDRLRDAEEAGKLGKSKTSRAVRKMLENRLAVIGLVVFAIILISCLLAPLISPYDPLTTDLRAMTQSRGSFTFHFVRYEARISWAVMCSPVPCTADACLS
jgi:peptide/nickel transport system permease protein